MMLPMGMYIIQLFIFLIWKFICHPFGIKNVMGKYKEISIKSQKLGMGMIINYSSLKQHKMSMAQ